MSTKAELHFSLLIILSYQLVVLVQCYGGRSGFNPLGELLMRQGELWKEVRVDMSTMDWSSNTEYSPVYVGCQDGLKNADKIESLPGQPHGVNFDQYSGYVTIDAEKGKALFYYFVESPKKSSTKPLLLWLNGGPGCSSFGNGAMMELGPFRVKSDGETLYLNEYAWNKEANIIFLESPAGVGFSYSNTTSDYELSGDKRTAEDSYTFLINWLERFPEYKTRDFFIAGESYAGHFVPQLAQLILHRNKNTSQTVINLRGIAMGNAYIDFKTCSMGRTDYFWTHAIISDEIKEGISTNCKFLIPKNETSQCQEYVQQEMEVLRNIYIYDIYAPLCDSSSNSSSIATFDPCSADYINIYLNNQQVQRALHANVTALPYPWESCSTNLSRHWKDIPLSMLPVIRELMASDISVWLYSGDTDGMVPITSTRYAIYNLGTPVKTRWYPWYAQDEVGGYAEEYQNLTFVTIREAGHFVPSYQPARALTFFSSFIKGKLPPLS
ncbi:Peptidase S10 [Macleaya cordata]|uniref:Carboxypeptidase n=1 Tax=Macleaya cordata TaxID=56857 RepID=A0A200PNL4_MACCD|nr:Peptidase S10 [Macleaya cordata]